MKKIVVGVFGMLLLFLSCEKVIQLPLDEASQSFVVEAVFKDFIGENYVEISKSGTVYDEGTFEQVESAEVKIIDESGVETVLDYKGGGRYSADLFQIVPGQNYTLNIDIDGELITSTSYVPSKPLIDSLTYLKVPPGLGGSTGESLNLVSFHSVDNGDEKNFYWLKIFRNGKENRGFYLGNDDFINGDYYSAQFFGSEARDGDTVFVEMISMDEPTYNYMVGLNNNLQSGPFAAAPANPPTNLVGGSLGFFGAFSTDTIGIVIP